jgi:hypothetical protein
LTKDKDSVMVVVLIVLIETDNLLYLSSLSQEELTILLQNIANHYGVTKNEIYAEVTDFDSYPLYDMLPMNQ